MENGKILVVEDDSGIAALERRRLERAGNTVVTAATPDAAMQEIKQGGVELVVLDYMLPGDVTGLEFYEQLKSIGYHIPVIMVTGMSDETTVIRALRAGVRDFVTKSVEYLDYLPEAAQRVLAHERTRKKLAEAETRLYDVERRYDAERGALHEEIRALRLRLEDAHHRLELVQSGKPQVPRNENFPPAGQSNEECPPEVLTPRNVA